MCAGIAAPAPSTPADTDHRPQRQGQSPRGPRPGTPGRRIAQALEADRRLVLSELAAATQSLTAHQTTLRQEVTKQALKTQTAGLKHIADAINRAGGLQALVEAEERRRKELAEMFKAATSLADLQIRPPSLSLRIPSVADLLRTDEIAKTLRDWPQQILQATQGQTSAMQDLSERLRSAAAGDLHISPRIFASPLLRPQTPQDQEETLPSQEPERRLEQPFQPWSCRQLEHNTANLQEEAATQHLLKIVNDFVEADALTSNARAGLRSVVAWFKLNENRLSPQTIRNLNLLLHAFLREQLGLGGAPELQQLLNSGLLVPQQALPPEEPDLDPKIYSTKEITKELKYSDATIRKKAKEAKALGPGPQRLGRNLSWFVVAAPENSEGGRGCGWKFQKLREDAKPQKPPGRVRKSA